MNIVFYRAPRSSAVPVASVLTELQVPHERIQVDLQKGEQKKPAFLALNPNGKVPTLVVDGRPMFEAVAMMQWLGERFGVAKKLWPAAEDPARLDALSWSSWAYVTLGGAIQRFNFASSEFSTKELHHAPSAAYAKTQVFELFGMLEARLSKQPFMLGESFSVLDLIVGSMVIWANACGLVGTEQPALNAWVEKLKARPSIRDEWQ
ncbi:MAG TPA: glutathione S-transferase family protein [Polyangiales bacterium]|jgi:GST-like protein|nr:glutathione S-transferase family protein [Polyangiales bacterium]